MIVSAWVIDQILLFHVRNDFFLRVLETFYQ